MTTKLDWLESLADTPGDGHNWSRWYVSDLVLAARALEDYACHGLDRCPSVKLKDGTCIEGLSGRCGDPAFKALAPLLEEVEP